MLKVKHLIPFKPKIEKGGHFYLPRLQKKSNSARFILQPGVAFSLILTKIWFSIERK